MRRLGAPLRRSHTPDTIHGQSMHTRNIASRSLQFLVTPVAKSRCHQTSHKQLLEKKETTGNRSAAEANLECGDSAVFSSRLWLPSEKSRTATRGPNRKCDIFLSPAGSEELLGGAERVPDSVRKPTDAKNYTKGGSIVSQKGTVGAFPSTSY